MITDERLQQLIELHDGRWIFDGMSDTAAALRELQDWRRHMPSCSACGKVQAAEMYLCQCPASGRTDYCCVHGAKLFDQCDQCDQCEEAKPTTG